MAPLRAVKQQDRTPTAAPGKEGRRKKDKKKASGRRRFTEVDEEDYGDDDFGDVAPAPLPKAPAGFVLDPEGNVLMVSSKRLISIVSA